MSSSSVDVLFSDLDGTLVHYPKELLEYAEIVSEDEAAKTATIRYKGTGEVRDCVMLSSKTGGRSFLSIKTKTLIQKLRDMGVVFVIITGARTSTYISRQPLLPDADFEFFENGGRKLHNGKLDPIWTDGFVNQVGPIADRSSLLPELPPAARREGTLWSLHNIMVADGWKVDARDYTVNVRVDVKKSEGKSESDFEALIDREVAKRGLATSYNLGKADFYPAGSGKANAARHVLDLLNIKAENAVAMFDDDNDVELGALCGRSYLPGVTHPSVLEAMKRHPSWTLMDREGFLGTEAALEAIIALRQKAVGEVKETAEASS